MTDLEQVESIVGAASGRTIGNELTFAFPEVSEVIGLCTQNEIAVLGVEVLEVRRAVLGVRELVGDEPRHLEAGPLGREADVLVRVDASDHAECGERHLFVGH